MRAKKPGGAPKLPAFERYGELYPSLFERLEQIANLKTPFVRKRADILTAHAERRRTERESWICRRYALTPTEAEIAIFLAEGGTVATYAAQAGVKPSTVRTHLKSVFAKTGVRRQAELAARLLLPLSRRRRDSG